MCERTECAKLVSDWKRKEGGQLVLIIQKMLEMSMRLDKSDRKILRILGRILGIFPVCYSKRLEKRLFEGTWEPVHKYRRRKKHRCFGKERKNQFKSHICSKMKKNPKG